MVVVTAEELEIAVKREVAIVVPVVVVAAAAVVDWVFGKAAVDLYWKDLC